MSFQESYHAGPPSLQMSGVNSCCPACGESLAAATAPGSVPNPDAAALCADACACGWRSAAAAARQRLEHQPSLPLGEGPSWTRDSLAPDWRQEVRASLSRHRQRRARLTGEAPSDPPSGPPPTGAGNVIPFRRDPALIPIIRRASPPAAAPALQPPSAVEPRLEPRPEPVAESSSQPLAEPRLEPCSEGQAELPAAPLAEPLAETRAEPLAEPVVLPQAVSPSLPATTLPLPFADPLESPRGMIEFGAVASGFRGAPPQEVASRSAAPARELSALPAGAAARARAALHDGANALLLAGVFALAAWAALGFPAFAVAAARQERLWAVFLLALPAVWWALFTATCLRRGEATPGMRRARLTLVDFSGAPARRSARRRRAWTSWLSLGALGLGFFWMLLDPDGLTWHDHLSRTVLTSAPSAPRQRGGRNANNAANAVGER